LYFQRASRREGFRKDAAQAIESTRTITRDLERFSAQETPDPAEIERVWLRWNEQIRNQLVGFTSSQPSEDIRREGRGLANDIDDALQLIRQTAGAETQSERATARTEFNDRTMDLYRQVNNLRFATGIGGGSRRAGERSRDETSWWRAYPGEPEEWRPLYRFRASVGRALRRGD
jgi:hypothetical protein